uniref:Fn3_PAP domain-containing protein n=1 Tax=Angiostrongylus cantonensis TaxID=6313 RepID=A0A0K0D0M3_ANGCA
MLQRYLQDSKPQVPAEGNKRVIPFSASNAFTTTLCGSYISLLPLLFSLCMYVCMHACMCDWLNVQQSASKPSLFSSHWSIHAQIQNSDQLDVDVKNYSKSSLPDAFELKSYSLRGTKSLSGILKQ